MLWVMTWPVSSCDLGDSQQSGAYLASDARTMKMNDLIAELRPKMGLQVAAAIALFGTRVSRRSPGIR